MPNRFCFWLVFVSLDGSLAQQTLNKVVDFAFTQCGCLAEDDFLPIDSQQGFDGFGLSKSALTACPVVDGFAEASYQGVVAQSNQDNIFSSMSSQNFSPSEIDELDGLSFEIRLNATNFENPSETTTSILLDWADDEDLSTLPSFLCGIKTNPTGGYLEALFASTLMDDDSSFRFALGSISDFSRLHFVCGFRQRDSTYTPYVCIDGNCDEDEFFSFTSEQIRALTGNIHLGIGATFVADFDRRPVSSVTFLTFSAYTTGFLDDTAVQQSTNTDNLRNYPVPLSPARLVLFEDATLTGPSGSFFFDLDSNSNNQIQTFDGNVSVGSLVPTNNPGSADDFLFTFTPSANFFTSTFTDNQAPCTRDSEFVNAWSYTVFDPEAVDGCVIAAEQPVEVCIRESNDAPVAESSSLIVVNSLESEIVFSFAPGSDVDDLSQAGQVPLGGITGGSVELDVSELSGSLFEFVGGVCGNQELETGDIVSLDDDQMVQLCFLRGDTLDPLDGAVGTTSFDFRLIDALGQSSIDAATIDLQVQELLSTCDASCTVSTIENQPTEVILDGRNLLEEEIIYSIQSLPGNGIISSNGVRIVDLPFDLGVANTVTYTPRNDYYNQNSTAGFMDGVGNPICAGVVGPCSDGFTFAIEFQGSQRIDTFSVFVESIQNAEPLFPNRPAFAVASGGSFDLDEILVDGVQDGDMYELTLIISPGSGITISYPDGTRSNSLKSVIDYPSNLNAFLADSEVSVSSSSDTSITFDISNVLGSSSITAEIFVDDSATNDIYIIAGIGAGASLIAIGVLYFFVFSKNKHSKKSFDTEELEDVDVGDEDAIKVVSPAVESPRKSPSQKTNARRKPDELKAKKGNAAPKPSGTPPKVKAKNNLTSTTRSNKDTKDKHLSSTSLHLSKRGGMAPPPKRLSRHVEQPNEPPATKSPAPKGEEKVIVMGTFPNITYVKTTENKHI